MYDLSIHLKKYNANYVQVCEAKFWEKTEHEQICYMQ
jgi:hypothetical protein